MFAKILVFGDVHGRGCWEKVIELEQADQVIFLGDYVSTKEGIQSQQQIENMCSIMNVAEAIMLRGNHDLQHLGYYWARCSGKDPKVLGFMSQPDFVEMFLERTQFIHVYEDNEDIYLFSHAGISQTFFDNIKRSLRGDTIVEQLKDINCLPVNETFGFTPDSPYDYSGESKCQPCTWIRPWTLAEDPLKADKRIIQVVGHTPVGSICNIKEVDSKYPDVWLCDCLPSQYLVIENGDFKIKNVPRT